MTPRQLERIGPLLFGPEWQTPLAAALEVAPRTVRRWLSGERAVPENLANDLKPIIEAQIRPLAARLRALQSLAAEFDDTGV